MKITERQMITIGEYEVGEDIEDFIRHIKIQGVPKIERNTNGKIWAIDLFYHDGSTKTRFIIGERTREENEKLEELL